MKIFKLNETYINHYLVNKDTEKINKVEEFIQAFNLNPMIIDVWEFTKNLNIYPNKITEEEILYITQEGYKVIIKIQDGEITKLLKIKIIYNTRFVPEILYEGDFSYEKLKELLK